MDGIEEDGFWETLLIHLEEGRVIPIVGPALAGAHMGGEEVPLYRPLAARLAARLKITQADDAASPPSLDTIVSRFIRNGGMREEVYPQILHALRELAPAPGAALEQLAGIGGFDLFVSLTFDDLLIRALNAARYSGEARTGRFAFCPESFEDLPGPRKNLTAAAVYALFGRVSGSPEYVASDADLLEFVHALSSETRRPLNLFDALQRSHLLFIGCAFPDWLARLVVRVTRKDDLFASRPVREFLVDAGTPGDPGMVTFFESYSQKTRILPSTAEHFVAELARRWAVHAGTTPVGAPGATGAADNVPPDALPEMRPGSVFLSYASEDRAAVDRVAARLESLGLDVWLDRRQLEPGDAYDRKIRRNIKECALFVPLISANAEARAEGYFRLEWHLAHERTLTMAPNVRFLLPVVIDAAKPYNDSVPESFNAVQWTAAPRGELPEAFGALAREAVRDYRRRARAS